jgi:SET domain-containing protein
MPACFEIRTSPIHGLGLFASVELEAGAVLGTYQGRRYRARQASRLPIDSGVTYLFRLSDGSLIDGSSSGNALRHLNHSCQPNCCAFEVKDDNGRLQIVIETVRPVAAGEELFIDYQLDVDDPSEYACSCAATACRGTMAPA